QRDTVIAQSQRSSFCALRSRVFVFSAQIQDCLYADLLQRLEAAGLWLRATIELSVDHVKVWQLSIASFSLSERIKGQRGHQDARHKDDSGFQLSQTCNATSY